MIDFSKEQKKELEYENDWTKISLTTVTKTTGEELDFHIYHGQDVACVFGITDDEQAILLHEYFPSTHSMVPTGVAGMVETHPADTATNELLEETGCSYKELVYLGKVLNGKYTLGTTHFFLATGVEVVQDPMHEPAEIIDVSFVDKQTIMELVFSDQYQSVYDNMCARRAFDYLGWKQA